MEVTYDFVIKNAKVFDGTSQPVFEDVAITKGKVAARGKNLIGGKTTCVIDGQGQWLMPGLFDIHTHYDLEVEVAPGLPESLRHGTTSVVIANCSLGLPFGAQRRDGFEPIVDCYARVENMPKSVLRDISAAVDWNTPKEYLEHLDTLNLGPNIVPMMPHSMLRIEVMGFEDSISRDPSTVELETMQRILKESLDMGYVGFSTDALPFHFLANQPHTDKRIPTQFAKYNEIKALTNVVRERDAIWQATPPKDSTLEVIRTFLLTSGRFFGKPLKMTVVAALDIQNNRKILPLGLLLARLLNSNWVNGKFYLQALAAPFKVWADGPVTPLAEEIPELRKLNELDCDDREGRQQVLRDPEFIAAFKKMWMQGKQGFGLDRLKRLLRLEDYAFNRTMADMTVDKCPLQVWEGKTFDVLFERVKAFNSDKSVELSAEEKEIVERDFFWISDEADFVIQAFRTFDLDLSWTTITANRNINTVRKLIMDPVLLPGFNDCGAHLTNMAFYDCNLRALKIAAQGGDQDVAYMVKRLTRDAADVFGVNGGRIEIGDQADLILINPKALMLHDGESSAVRQYREALQHEQLVNRSDGVVDMVMIAGKVAWEKDDFTQAVGQQKFGRVLPGRWADTSA
jgi:N-acyl-D-aspartate/D-glutamate deacylase